MVQPVQLDKTVQFKHRRVAPRKADFCQLNQLILLAIIGQTSSMILLV